MPKFLLVRFSGMCAFVSNDRDINKATKFDIVMPDVEYVVRTDPHLPILTFDEKNYKSGGKTAVAVPVPGERRHIGSWQFPKSTLTMEADVVSPDLKKVGATLIASVTELGYRDEIINPDCINKPKTQPAVSALMEIDKGIVFCDPTNLVYGFAREGQWVVEIRGDKPSVIFKIFDFNKVEKDKLELTWHHDEFLLIGIANLSVPSFNAQAPEHPKAYGALLKDGSGRGAGLGCQPTKMVNI